MCVVCGYRASTPLLALPPVGGLAPSIRAFESFGPSDTSAPLELAVQMSVLNMLVLVVR